MSRDEQLVKAALEAAKRIVGNVCSEYSSFYVNKIKSLDPAAIIASVGPDAEIERLTNALRIAGTTRENLHDEIERLRKEADYFKLAWYRASAEVEAEKVAATALRLRVDELEALLREAYDIATGRVQTPRIIESVVTRIDAALGRKEEA